MDTSTGQKYAVIAGSLLGLTNGGRQLQAALLKGKPPPSVMDAEELAATQEFPVLEAPPARRETGAVPDGAEQAPPPAELEPEPPPAG